MDINIPVTKMLLPEGMLARAKPLLGFDGTDGTLYHVMLFDFGPDGGALGIMRDGDNFCARISLDALAEFNRRAAADNIGGTS